MSQISAMIGSLADNPYFGAGAGLFGLGMGAAVLKRAALVGQILFKRHCMVTVEVTSHDRCYNWLLRWLRRHSSGSERHMSVQTSFSQSESGLIESGFNFVPSPGEHYVRWRGRWIKVERNRQQRMASGVDEHGLMARKPFETVTLTTIGSNPNFYTSILENAKEDALGEVKSGTVIYHAIGHEWRQFGHPRRKRPLNSVVLDKGVTGTILHDVTDFIQSADWYIDRGIPYRRGYLLHGPPGCGKSSFVGALASELSYSICVLSLSERTLTDDRLDYLLNNAPMQSLILLEDIDAAFVSREDHPALKGAYEGLTRVTFSGLLNAIDGVSSSEGRLLFMTTNYISRLDPALIRPGRIDLQQYMGPCTDHQLATMFSNFYMGEVQPATVSSFVSNVRSNVSFPLSPAQVQGFLLVYKNQPWLAVQNAAELARFGKVKCD